MNTADPRDFIISQYQFLVDHLPSEMWERTRDEKGTSAMGWMILLDIRASYWMTDPEASSSGDDGVMVDISLDMPAFIMLPCFNHGVFYAEFDPTGGVDVEAEKFTCESTHESCWRSDGFSRLFPFYMDARKRLAEKVKQEARKRGWDVDFDMQSINWSAYPHKQKFVRCSLGERDEGERHVWMRPCITEVTETEAKLQVG